MLFFSSIKENRTAVKECSAARLPVVGVVDTDTAYSSVNVVIPGNDENTAAVVFFNSFFAKFILMRKFRNIAT